MRFFNTWQGWRDAIELVHDCSKVHIYALFCSWLFVVLHGFLEKVDQKVDHDFKPILSRYRAILVWMIKISAGVIFIDAKRLLGQ